MSKSLAEQLALLPEAEREAILADLDMEQLRWDANFWLRPEQMEPTYTGDVPWNIWLVMAGRGFGKSRAGSEWVREKAKYTNQGQLRFGLVARTAADVRDTIVEGESGVLNVHPPSEKPEYFPSKRMLKWPNGNTALLFTADEPDQLRGPNFHYSWGDEFAAWKNVPDASGLTAFDNMRIATRLGSHPQMCLTTTPKRVESVRNLIKEAESNGLVVITKGKTADNEGNLSQSYLDAIYGIYAGTRLARQELSGEMLDDVEGAMWMQNVIDDYRANTIPIGAPLRVVGVDPTVAERPGDECGIIVCAASGDRDLFKRQSWVLEDATMQGSPEEWARRVVETARKWGAPVVAEKNQGGVLIKNAITQIDPNIPVYEVWSKQGKALRAEPVSLAYEQGRCHHLGFFAELESQMTQWIPGEGKSPDRIDALVLAMTALLITPPKGFGGGSLVAHSVAQRRLPIPGRGAGGSTGRRSAVFGAGLKRR